MRSSHNKTYMYLLGIVFLISRGEPKGSPYVSDSQGGIS